MTALRDTLQGALVLAPMTKGSNLPYRQLCQELGARITMSEMTVARRLKQKRRSEFALIRRAPGEHFFGVQLAGNKPEEMAWAAELVAARGADLVDVNLGCPIDYFTSKGLGAALAREPNRVRRIVEAMKQAVQVPGHGEDPPRDGTTSTAISSTWRGRRWRAERTRSPSTDVRARRATRCRRTGRRSREVAAAMPVPVIGNGDLLFRQPDRRPRCGRGLHGRDVGARRADQAVAVPRSDRGRPRPDG